MPISTSSWRARVGVPLVDGEPIRDLSTGLVASQKCIWPASTGVGRKGFEPLTPCASWASSVSGSRIWRNGREDVIARRDTRAKGTVIGLDSTAPHVSNRSYLESTSPPLR